MTGLGSGFVALSTGARAELTLAAPAGPALVTLTPGTRYWLVLAVAGGDALLQGTAGAKDSTASIDSRQSGSPQSAPGLVPLAGAWEAEMYLPPVAVPSGEWWDAVVATAAAAAWDEHAPALAFAVMGSPATGGAGQEGSSASDGGTAGSGSGAAAEKTTDAPSATPPAAVSKSGAGSSPGASAAADEAPVPGLGPSSPGLSTNSSSNATSEYLSPAPVVRTNDTAQLVGYMYGPQVGPTEAQAYGVWGTVAAVCTVALVVIVTLIGWRHWQRHNRSYPLAPARNRVQPLSSGEHTSALYECRNP
ncbi:hypothetical protein HYH03_018497 [Edaphochlamys debaryana]|uniref:Uncharacterized protein n=1 Tax=Edaphochlamys debaryana TaxID=47281 RepID=A0A835XGE1_9CHLO|nr:hypothetical protein HYH03_018497 [Edaphochlamys debaryana]|eukprot:KAG2482572.1 hypothetical protein HYH03_018497 [Edaphochlamys debaryana]